MGADVAVGVGEIFGVGDGIGVGIVGGVGVIVGVGVVSAVSSRYVSSKLATLTPETPLGFSILQINLTEVVFAGAASEVTEYSLQALFAVVIPALFFAFSILSELSKNSILTQAKELSIQLSPDGVRIHALAVYICPAEAVPL